MAYRTIRNLPHHFNGESFSGYYPVELVWEGARCESVRAFRDLVNFWTIQISKQTLPSSIVTRMAPLLPEYRGPELPPLPTVLDLGEWKVPV